MSQKPNNSNNLGVYLVSMPFMYPSTPSIQINVLEGFLAQNGVNNVHAYNAHLPILINSGTYLKQKNFSFQELPYFAAMIQAGLVSGDLDQILKEVEDKFDEQTAQDFRDLVEKLTQATDEYLELELIPMLKRYSHNIICFTLNYNQDFSSFYALKYIEKKWPKENLTFVFGGASTSLPHFNDIVTRFQIPAQIVEGEGENKLLKIIRSQASQAKHGSDLRFQLTNTRSYDQYFNTLKKSISQNEKHIRMLPRVEIPLEFSRGCQLKCDFCSLNFSWTNYQMHRLTQEDLDQIEYLSKRYNTQKVRFVDNLCNPWVKKFIKLYENHPYQFKCHMELRAKEKREVYHKLSEKVLYSLELGIEALSENLLQRINKKTTLLDNLHAIKSVFEKNNLITSYLNILTFYPDSTLEDVARTKEVLSKVTHFPKFRFIPFMLSYGSPQWKSKSVQYAHLTPTNNLVIESLKEFSTSFMMDIPAPEQLPPDVCEAWTNLVDWYQAEMQKKPDRLLTLHPTHILDSREMTKEIPITELEYHFLSFLHDIRSHDEIIKNFSKDSLEDIQKVLERFILEDIIVESDGKFLNLCYE